MTNLASWILSSRITSPPPFEKKKCSPKHWVGNWSSRQKVISPEVMLPETTVMFLEIYGHDARYPQSSRPKFYQAYKLEQKLHLKYIVRKSRNVITQLCLVTYANVMLNKD